ncbi:MAG: HAD family hydrolase [bacterium]|jgi:FMN phosphatase YigB (HAD superfamily)
MQPDIEAIFLDVGNTLRIVVEDPAFQQQAKEELMRLIDSKESPEVFFEKVEGRWKNYRSLSKKSLLEASELELWTQWLLPDYPVEVVAPHISRLTRMWRDRDGRRVPRSDAKETIVELHRRGYLLGIIANTITETEIPDWMIADGVTGYFKTVILSSKVRVRKPDPTIYWLAARVMGVEPVKCAYLGDNPIRDVEGTRAAGFGMMILFEEPATIAKEPQSGDYKPDHIIKETRQLLDIFPPRQ